MGFLWSAFYLNPVSVVVKEENPAASHLLGLHHGLEVSQQAHVLAHVRRQHHVDHHLAQRLPLLLCQVDEDITVMVLQQLKRHCNSLKCNS